MDSINNILLRTDAPGALIPFKYYYYVKKLNSPGYWSFKDLDRLNSGNNPEHDKECNRILTEFQSNKSYTYWSKLATLIIGLQ